MPLPDYTYGKVTGLTPDLTVVSERGESPFVCCGYCSAHMAARTAKNGLSTSMFNEAHDIRSAGGRPHDNGNNASELRTGAKEALGVTLSSISRDGIPERLRTGHAVTVGLDYDELPSHLKVQGGVFGHAACLFGWKEDGDYVGYFDPLYDQGARGALVPWSQLKPALWGDGNHSTTTVRLTVGTGSFAVYTDDIDVRRVCDVKAGTDFFKDVQLTQRLGEYSKDSTGTQILGYLNDAYAIEIRTGTLYSDGETRPTCVYIPKSKATNVRVNPAPSPAPPTDSEAVAARDAEWRAWIDAAPEGIGRAAQSARALVAWAETAPDKE